MTKKLLIKIRPDGTVESKTINIKGKSCEKYISTIERISESQVVDSKYTQEYYETENDIEIINNEYVEEVQ